MRKYYPLRPTRIDFTDRSYYPLTYQGEDFILVGPFTTQDGDVWNEGYPCRIAMVRGAEVERYIRPHDCGLFDVLCLKFQVETLYLEQELRTKF